MAATPAPRRPVTSRRRTASRGTATVWVASTSRTCVVPMPKATAPSAPWAEVCESPQATVMPGWVRPSSGPTTWTMPWRPEPAARYRMPWAAALRSSSDTMASASPSA